MQIRSLAAAASLALVVLVGVACDGGGEEPSEGTSTPTSTTPSSTSEGVVTPVPEHTATATGVLDCGLEERIHGEGRDPEARRCLGDAYAEGRDATFTSSRLTIEGDPVIWTITVDASGDVHVEIDTTRDRFSAPEDRIVRTYTCASLALTEADGAATIELAGCDIEGGTLVV